LERRLEHGQKTIKLLNQMENKIQNQQSRPKFSVDRVIETYAGKLNEDYPKVKKNIESKQEINGLLNFLININTKFQAKKKTAARQANGFDLIEQNWKLDSSRDQRSI
jgi:hypothetical protein